MTVQVSKFQGFKALTLHDLKGLGFPWYRERLTLKP